MPKDGNKHHSEYPDELLVGCRGTMIPFDKLADAPDVRVRLSGFEFKLEAGDVDVDEPEESDDLEIRDLQSRKDAAWAEYRRLKELVKQSKREDSLCDSCYCSMSYSLLPVNICFFEIRTRSSGEAIRTGSTG